MPTKRDRDERDRDRDRGRDDEDLQDILEELGRTFSKFMQKVAEKGEELLSGGGLDDLFGGFDFPGGEAGPSTGTARKRPRKPKPQREPSTREPAVDVFDEGDEVLIYVELPGVEQDDIQIQMQGRRISLSARHAEGVYAKEIELPEGTTGLPSYHFKNGILRIRLSKEDKDKDEDEDEDRSPPKSPKKSKPAGAASKSRSKSKSKSKSKSTSKSTSKSKEGKRS